MRGNDVSIIRAIRGPITLITIGVLFALNNFTPYRFEQTWPVILIVFGLLSLLRRGTEPQAPVGAPPAAGQWTPPPNYPPPGTYRQSQYPQTAPPPPAAGQPSGGPAGNAPGSTGGTL